MKKTTNTIKKISLICMLVLCICIISGIAVYAANSEAPEKVKVGYYPLDGFYEKDENGVLSGYGYEFLHMLSGYADFEYEYIGFDKNWNELLDMLDSGEIDMLTSVQYSDERAEKFDFSNFSVGYSEVVLTTAESNEKLIPGDYRSYENMRVGMMEGSSLNEKMFSFAEDHNFTFKPVYFGTQLELDNAVQEGTQVDAIVNSSMNILKNENILERFGRAPYYVVVKKDNVELMDKVNNAMGKMELYEPAWQTDLYKKYYAVNDAHMYLNEEQRIYLKKLKDSGTVISAVINPDLKPYSYFEGDKAKGILVEYFNKVCDLYGLQVNYIKTATAEEYTKAVIKHESDVVLVPYFLRYEADTDGYNLTQHFMEAAFCLVTRKGEIEDEKFKGKKIAVVAGMTSVEQAGREDFKGAEFVYYTTSDECIDAVKNNEADGTLLYSYTTYQYLNHDWKNEIEMHGMPDSSISFSIAVSKECDPMLYELMDYAINMIPDNQIEEIILPTILNSKEEESILEYIYHRPQLWNRCIAVVVAVLLIICFLIAKSHTNRLRMKQKKAEYNAAHDPLTGVYNRQGYEEILTRFEKDRRPFAYIQLDIDDFKNINDTYGHKFGDETLKTVAQEIKSAFRADDLVFRFGGDEFAVLLVNYKKNSWDSIGDKQRSIHLNVNQTLSRENVITISMGVCWSEEGFSEKMVELADDALYRVKKAGRAGCCVYDTDKNVLFEWKDSAN